MSPPTSRQLRRHALLLALGLMMSCKTNAPQMAQSLSTSSLRYESVRRAGGHPHESLGASRNAPGLACDESHGRDNKMESEVCVLQVKVLAHWTIQKFSGEAVLADADPRFVVALLIADTKAPFLVEETGVTFASQRVAFFAIHSITKVFAESDVLGKDYRLQVRQMNIAGRKVFSINAVGE